ncbi:MAG: M20/M25/M40 family metallo-hydrolase [Gemmatimonadaceae bacterium]|nr:M20/M25/M40 family metallo-hydrolase [Chitinophagaceae bacterium]
MRRLGLVFFSFISFLSLNAQSDDSIFIAKISDEILSSGKAYENLRVLCKTVGARLAGSPGMYKAEAWGEAALKDAGADKVWLQECMVPFWTRGGNEEASYSYTDASGKKLVEKLDVLALGNSIGTGGIVIKAPVILINNFDELESRKNELKGKIVFFNYPFNPTYVHPFKAYGESGAYRRSGPSRAAKYGAVAVVIRSMSGSAADNHPHTGTTTYDTTVAKIPAAAMGLRDADKLSELLKKGAKVELSYKSNAKFNPDAKGHNVIGEITGTEFPNEIITIGGHLDSWDPAEGAHDDGAGCVHSIEVLRSLKKLGYKPKRTIRIVLFANEENGLRGGQKYADEGKTRNEKYYFALESDAGGFTPRGFGCTMEASQLEKLRTWLPLFQAYGVSQFTAGGGGADIGPLRTAFKTPLAGLSPDGQRYFDLHHARNDVFENVNRRELELGAINMTALIYLIDKYGIDKP